MNDTLVRTEDILTISAQRYGERSVVIDRAGYCSYHELSEAALFVYKALQECSIPAGSVIGISILGARDFLATLFGILHARCIAIPISPSLSSAEQRRIVSETEVSWVISHSNTTTAHPESIHTISHTALTQSLTINREAPPLQHTPIASFPDAAIIRHTSGTTAHSKGVVLSHRAILERAEISRTLLGVQDTDIVLAPLPLAYHFVASALAFLRSGATIIDSVSLSAAEMLAMGELHGATLIYASPLQYELLCRSTTAETQLPLRSAFSTSALLSKSTAELFYKTFALRLTQVYGVIEIGLPIWNTLSSLEPNMLGQCKAPYECTIVDEYDSSVPSGKIGELLIRGPGLFSGYLYGRDAGVAHHNETWFRTGDLVTRDKIGVEEVLQLAPTIQATRVFAEPHALLGSLVVAEIVLAPGATQDIESWRALCYSSLSGYKVPKEFRIIDSLPTTGSGKIIRHSRQKAIAES